jgi:hypothetical protein
MICPKCRTSVPDQSAFCLACGAPLAPQPIPGNGNAPGVAGPAVAEAAAGSRGAPPGGKQAYTLSFGPLVDDRLRYKVAKWVVERAPAHPLAEIQEGLQRGTFVTFLALTTEEADAARHGIHGLGVAPALLRLTPATTAQMLLLDRPQRDAARKRPVGLADWRAVLAAGVGLLIFGLVIVRFIGGRGF